MGSYSEKLFYDFKNRPSHKMCSASDNTRQQSCKLKMVTFCVKGDLCWKQLTETKLKIFNNTGKFAKTIDQYLCFYVFFLL